MQAERGEDEGERIEEGAHDDEGVDGRVGQEVRVTEGAHLVQAGGGLGGCAWGVALGR